MDLHQRVRIRVGVGGTGGGPAGAHRHRSAGHRRYEAFIGGTFQARGRCVSIPRGGTRRIQDFVDSRSCTQRSPHSLGRRIAGLHVGALNVHAIAQDQILRAQVRRDRAAVGRLLEIRILFQRLLGSVASLGVKQRHAHASARGSGCGR
jgi:hypothetical protein